MSSLCEEEAELANWDPRRDDYHNPKSLIIDGDGPAANFVRTNNLARSKEVVTERPGLYVRNVPLRMDDEGLQRLFSEHGKVLSGFVSKSNRDRTTNTWGIVKAENMKDALHMIEGLNGKPPLNLKVEIAMTAEERDRRRQQKAEEAQHVLEMEKLVESFDSSTMVPTKKSGFGRGRINLSGSDEGSPRRPGSLSTSHGSSSVSKEKTLDCSKPIVPSPSSQKAPLTSSPSSEAVGSPSGTKGCSRDEAIGRRDCLPRYEECDAAKLPVGEETTVLVMTNENPQTIMVMPFDRELIKSLETLQVEINSHCEALTKRLYRPVTSEVCLARWSRDGIWYRAACMLPDVSRAYVIFVDYGNMAYVPHEDIRQMDPKFLRTPLMAQHCIMTGIDTDMPDAIKLKCSDALKQLLPVDTKAIVSILSHNSDTTYTISIPYVLEALKKQGLIE